MFSIRNDVVEKKAFVWDNIRKKGEKTDDE